MAEKEYIEREAAKNSICQYCRDIKPENCEHKDECNVICRLDAIPAAEVRPVVRGRWIMNDESKTVCSLCGNVVAFVSHPDRRWDFGNFCPNCGADMREENNE